jgi:hypothetical protein
MRQPQRAPLRVAPPDQRISPARGRSPRRRNGSGFPAATRWPEIRETPSSAPSSGHLFSEPQTITPVQLHDHDLVLSKPFLNRVQVRQLLDDLPNRPVTCPSPSPISALTTQMLSSTAPARGQDHRTTTAIAQRAHHPCLPVRAADPITAIAAKKPFVIKPSAARHSKIAGLSFTLARLLRVLRTPPTYPAHTGTNEMSGTAPDNPAVVRRLQRTCTPRKTCSVGLVRETQSASVPDGLIGRLSACDGPSPLQPQRRGKWTARTSSNLCGCLRDYLSQERSDAVE